LAISIIVCSRSKENLHFIINSISQTIGVEFEILYSLNASEGGLSKAYNTLALHANFPILIFLHDDLVFHDNNWGIRIIEILKNEKIGLIGLMGTVYKSKFKSIWTSCEKTLFRNSNFSSNDISYQKVAVLDGCFMAVSKLCFTKYKFDERLCGFHGYDLDYSLVISGKFDVVVATNIKFDHLSPGRKNKEWYKDITYVHNKWDSVLPLSISKMPKYITHVSDYYALCDYFNSILNFNFSKIHLFKLVLKMLFCYFRFNRFKYTRTIFRIIIS
jgi:glycosyltransferase involved in cell wall biosynthesis